MNKADLTKVARECQELARSLCLLPEDRQNNDTVYKASLSQKIVTTLLNAGNALEYVLRGDQAEPKENPCPTPSPPTPSSPESTTPKLGSADL